MKRFNEQLILKKVQQMSLLLCFPLLLTSFVGCSDSDNNHDSGSGNEISVEDIRIIPLPQYTSYGRGAFEVDKNVTVSYSAGIETEANLLLEYLKEDYDMQPVLVDEGEKSTIQLIIDPAMTVEVAGGYRLEVAENKIRLAARDALGIFYGSQSIRQLITLKNNKFQVREVTISDYPSYSWRGVMLDEGRFFKGKKTVKTLLDEMARLKMNTFHWHLTDDQGWRIDIHKYPKLTEIGSKRKCTGLGWSWENDQFDNIPQEGFYTQEDIKEIVAYAKKLNITIVPEIEILTHCTAAVASYPRLGTTGKQIEVECRLGVFDEVFNIADEWVMQFAYDVLDEVTALFPGEFFHVGGDELHGNHWQTSPDIRKLKSDLGITEDFELQIYYFNQINKYLNSKGKKMMGWSDITGKAGVTSKMKVDMPGAISQYWAGTLNDLNHSLNLGFKVVQSHTDFAYFNAWLPDAYKTNCIPAGVDASKTKNIIGIEAACWSEFDSTIEKTFDHIFPRIAAYAETGWSKPSSKDYKSFLDRLSPMYDRWKAKNIYVGGTEESR